MKCIDSSILIYAADKNSKHHQRAVDLLGQTAKGEWPSCICYPSLTEFIAIVTDEKRVKNPLSSAQAQKMADRLLKYPQPQILFPDETILRHAFKLMQKYPALKNRFFKAQLAATMMAHGVKTLVTANSFMFSALREIETENPFEALFA